MAAPPDPIVLGERPIVAAPPTPASLRWVALTLFVVAMVAAYRPAPDSVVGLLRTLGPWAVGLGAFVGFGWGRLGATPRWAAIIAALAGWVLLVADDPRWSIVSFTVLALCYEAPGDQPRVGLVAAAATTAAWTVGWWLTEPGWNVIVPAAVFAASAAIAALLVRERRLIEHQAELIGRLEATQVELAGSERNRGVLEERARLAGEIHDTLAQGFTSIVLLSRAAGRRAPELAELGEIEHEAQHHLDSARRLVADSGPVELASVSLPSAIERVAASTLDEVADWTFEIIGSARSLPGEVDVTLLRMAQESLVNAKSHAAATSVSIRLDYNPGDVVLTVADDGVGLCEGVVADRGSLTGGQGLRLLGARARAVGGRLEVNGRSGAGTEVRLTVPDVES